MCRLLIQLLESGKVTPKLQGRVCGLALGVAIVATAASAQRDQPYRTNLPADHAAIEYDAGPFDDPIARLAEAVASGAATLDYDTRFGYLPSLLDRLDIRVDSQVLVFSKTSFQADKVSPRHPRAIYFNDDVAVGIVQDADVIELAAFDALHGGVFYTLDAGRSGEPRFARPNGCLRCHQGPATLGVPGPYVGSVSTSATGRPDIRLGTVVTDHRTPFEERWGGWYVTGTHGALRHRGNAQARDPTRGAGLVETANQNLTTLVRFVDPGAYLALTSDLIALMTLEHQTQMVNLFTRAAWETRIASHDGLLNDTEAVARRSSVDEIVRYMLFADEALLRDPIRGVSSFTETFPTRGPRDRHGRSLRDLDLQTRLFRYPLSYMIYSDLFDGLPDPVRALIYERLFEVLRGDATTDRFDRLSAQDRQAILEILRETKPGLPPYWQAN